MKILVLGAGAIGGYFGGRLVEAGAQVTFLVRERRLRQLAEHGLQVRSKYGDIDTPVRAVAAADPQEPADFVILTCKAYDLDSAIDTVRPAVGPRTAVLPLLNGLAHLERLNAVFGKQRVLGGLAKIAATLKPDGVIEHLNDWRYITFGEQEGGLSDRVHALKAEFDKTSVVASAVPNVMQSMWEKLVHLSTVAGMTCLMRASVGEIARTEDGTGLMIHFLEANAEIAAKAGFGPSAAFIAEYRALFSNKNSTYTASMLRDLERGGRIEADHVLGFMLRKAREFGIDDTLHRAAYVHTKAYEERRAAGRL